MSLHAIGLPGSDLCIVHDADFGVLTERHAAGLAAQKRDVTQKQGVVKNPHGSPPSHTTHAHPRGYSASAGALYDAGQLGSSDSTIALTTTAQQDGAVGTQRGWGGCERRDASAHWQRCSSKRPATTGSKSGEVVRDRCVWRGRRASCTRGAHVEHVERHRFGVALVAVPDRHGSVKSPNCDREDNHDGSMDGVVPDEDDYARGERDQEGDEAKLEHGQFVLRFDPFGFH